jgi:hypothetical protein
MPRPDVSAAMRYAVPRRFCRDAVCRVARDARFRRRVQPLPTGLVSTALPYLHAFAPPREPVQCTQRCGAGGEMSREASASGGAFDLLLELRCAEIHFGVLLS